MTYNRRYQWPEARAVLALIAVNIIFLIALLVSDDLYITLGLQSAEWYREPWTLLTSLFVHDFPWHILANMFSLYFLGSYLCNMIGDARFLTVYFVGGIIGNFFYILIEHLLGHENSLAFGASGAIFSVAGAFTVLAPKLKVIIFPIPIPMPLWIAVIGGFIILTLPALFIDTSIGWQAHLGGLIVGLIAGFFLRKRKRNIIMF
jgi:membrane associated rhomboid family serine protease